MTAAERPVGAKPCLDCGSMNHGRCVRPQERPVTGDGLDLEAAKRLEEAATSGPWAVPGANVFRVVAPDAPHSNPRQGHHPPYPWRVVADLDGPDGSDDDARFIAAARTLVPALITEVERLRAALDEAQLRSIEARNPGIDMDEVRRLRTEGGTS
jgi:hypothetical protein